MLTGVTTGCIVIPASVYFLTGNVNKYSCLLIKKQLHYLKLEEGSVEKYVNDFINKMDESRVVKYLGLYSPYKSPVPNPFAYTLYPPEKVQDIK